MSLFNFTFTPQNGEEDMLSEGKHSILSHIPRFTESLERRQPTEQSFLSVLFLDMHTYMIHVRFYVCVITLFYVQVVDMYSGNPALRTPWKAAIYDIVDTSFGPKCIYICLCTI